MFLRPNFAILNLRVLPSRHAPLRLSESMATTAAPASALRHWGAASKYDDGQFYASYHCRIIQGYWRTMNIHRLTVYVIEYMHSRVICHILEGNLVLYIFSPRCCEFGCQYQCNRLICYVSSVTLNVVHPSHVLCLLANKVKRCRYCSRCRIFTRSWRQWDDVRFGRRAFCPCNIIARTGTGRQLSASSSDSWSSPVQPRRNV